jgi:cytochrome c
VLKQSPAYHTVPYSEVTAELSLRSGMVVMTALLCWAHTPAWAEPIGGNAVSGRAIYEAKCSACHSVDDNRVGPKHAGVLGRKAGGVKDYDYSDALRHSRVIWSPATLRLWLTDPEAVIPGQKMGYRLGLAQERDDVIAFLATLR